MKATQEYSLHELSPDWLPWQWMVKNYYNGKFTGDARFETREAADIMIETWRAQGFTERVEARVTLGTSEGHRIVYLDGAEVRRFDVRSDDYAYSNADDYRNKLVKKLKEERA